MTPAELMVLAQQLLYDCCDPVTGEPLYTGQSSYACVEDVEAAAHYLRDCAEAEPVATVRVHDTGGNAGIAWTGVPTENSGVMRGGTPLYEHPQPPSTQAEPVAWRITDGEGGYDYRDDPPEDWQVAWVARWGRKHEPLYTQPHPQPPSDQDDAVEALRGVASEHDIGYAAGWRACADEAARIVASHIDRLEPGKQLRTRDALLDLLASMRSILVSQRAAKETSR